MVRGNNFRNVKVQVLIGSLMVEDPLGKKYAGKTKIYSKGAIFSCPLWRAKKFSHSSVKILEEDQSLDLKIVATTAIDPDEAIITDATKTQTLNDLAEKSVKIINLSESSILPSVKAAVKKVTDRLKR